MFLMPSDSGSVIASAISSSNSTAGPSSEEPKGKKERRRIKETWSGRPAAVGTGRIISAADGGQNSCLQAATHRYCFSPYRYGFVSGELYILNCLYTRQNARPSLASERNRSKQHARSVRCSS